MGEMPGVFTALAMSEPTSIWPPAALGFLRSPTFSPRAKRIGMTKRLLGAGTLLVRPKSSREGYST